MPQSFVRYSPDVERADPDFEQALQTVLDMMKRHMNGSLKAEGIGRVVRDAHAKGYGLAQAEVEILGGLPEVYAQGIYANPGRHEVMVRFSNGTSHTAADRFLGATAGIGLKMFGIEGKTLLEDEPDSHTFDLSRRVPEFADRVVRRSLDANAEEQVFRPALVAELRERPYEFDIQVQLCTDLEQMPVEDVTVRWSETLSPYVTVARLRLPRQDIGGEDNLERMDAVSITPWRVTEEHRPLGNIMRVRKEVYRQSSTLRHQMNHQVRKEPSNLEDVFGSSTASAAAA